jgi:hypothetical protein
MTYELFPDPNDYPETPVDHPQPSTTEIPVIIQA